MWLKMSYALGVTLASGEYPKNMYITPDDPMRTLRTATYEGRPIMIFGGESHEYDDATYDEARRYRALITDVRRRFDVEKVHLRWLAGDFMPYDRMPYIGKVPGEPGVYVITGYRAWGLAWAMSAGEAIAADLAGDPQAWVEPFSTDRLARALPAEDRVHGI